MEEKKEHHLTRAKRLREEALAQAVEWSVDSVAPDIKNKVEYRVMNKRWDIAYYAYSRKEAEDKVKEYEWGYIVTV